MLYLFLQLLFSPRFIAKLFCKNKHLEAHYLGWGELDKEIVCYRCDMIKYANKDWRQWDEI